MGRPFDRRTVFRNFDEFVLVVGNGEACEAQHAIDLMKRLRDEEVDMIIVKIESSTDDHYFVFLTIPYFESRRQFFKEGDTVLVTWEAAPVVLSREERDPGVKALKDQPFGWRGVIMSEDTMASSLKADVVLLLERPRKSDHPLKDKEMKHLDIQYIYIYQNLSFFSYRSSSSKRPRSTPLHSQFYGRI